MRLLLDAHVSGPGVGRRLAESGHDVRAIDQERELEGLDDEDVLALAVRDNRILVTQDVEDFPAIAREWATGGRSHAGVILIYRIDHREFGLIVRGIERALAMYPDPESWIDLTASVDRAFATAGSER